MNIYTITVKSGVTLYKIKTESPHDVMKQLHDYSDSHGNKYEAVFFQYNKTESCLSLALSENSVKIPSSESTANLCAVTVSGTGLEEKQAAAKIISSLGCPDSIYGISMSEVELTLLLPESCAKTAGDRILSTLGIDI